MSKPVDFRTTQSFLDELNTLVKQVRGTPKEKAVAKCLEIFLEEVNSLLPKIKADSSNKAAKEDQSQLAMTKEEMRQLEAAIDEMAARKKRK